MPTKPGTSLTFATDAAFSSGPASGLDTKEAPTSLAQGFTPGDGIGAEEVNYLFNLVGVWIDSWLRLGSSAADGDAHIVETDSSGFTNVRQLGLSNIGTPARGALKMAPQTAPSAASEGDLWTLAGSAGVSRTKLRYQDADGAAGGGSAGPMTVWASPAGHAAAYLENLSFSTSAIITKTTKIDLLLKPGVTTPNTPEGDYFVTFSCAVSITSGADLSTRALLEFIVIGGPDDGKGIEYEIVFSGLDQAQAVSATWRVGVDSGGTDLLIRYRSSAVGETMAVEYATISAVGVVDV